MNLTKLFRGVVVALAIGMIGLTLNAGCSGKCCKSKCDTPCAKKCPAGCDKPCCKKADTK